jgi:hypothetical protein
MFTLELYKSRDPAQPLRFTALDEAEVLDLVRWWMGRNCPGDLTLPVDDQEWPHKVTLFWTIESRHIAWADTGDKFRFKSFEKTQEVFIDACSYQVTVCRG